MNDPYDLQRFVDAQDQVMPEAVAELQAGRKASHWMWFVFPQIRGLGTSATARRYAIRSAAEASAYLRHESLGPRLRRCTGIVNDLEGRSAFAIFGTPDESKFRSSMTLFAAVAPEEPLFAAALGKYFGGDPDHLTLAKLRE